MRSFVRAELVARRRMVLALAAGAALILLIVALAYEPLGVNGIGAGFRDRSPHILNAFSGSRSSDVLSPEGWLGFGFNHPVLLMTTLTVAIAIGSGSVAGEIDTGRAELLFTGPIARTRFLAFQVIVWLLAELVVMAGALAGGVLGVVLTPRLHSVGVGQLLLALLQYAPLVCFVAACAFLASAVASTRGRALGAAVGVAVLGYFLNVVSGLLGSLGWLRWLSPFGYYDPAKAISEGFQPLPAAALLAASALLGAAVVARLRVRDLA